MKTFLAIAAAGGALAIGVPAALGATDSPAANTPVQSATPTPAQPDQQRPDRGDCPEHDGNAPSGSGEASPTGSQI